MISKPHSDAARENGAKSHGPTSPQGKAASSRNSLRHGATAKAILLITEEPAAFHRLVESYYAKFQPADDVECDLVDEMAVSKWRLYRDWSNEAAQFDLEMDTQAKEVDEHYTNIPHVARYALAFRAMADNSKAIPLLTRYETSHRRSYYKALATLLELRSAKSRITPDPQNFESCETNPPYANPAGSTAYNEDPTPPSSTPTAVRPPAPPSEPAEHPQEPEDPLKPSTQPIPDPAGGPKDVE